MDVSPISVSVQVLSWVIRTSPTCALQSGALNFVYNAEIAVLACGDVASYSGALLVAIHQTRQNAVRATSTNNNHTPN